MCSFDPSALPKTLKLVWQMWGHSDLAVQPETVGEQAIRAIQTDEFYIFSDGKESRQMFEARTNTISDAFGRQFPR